MTLPITNRANQENLFHGSVPKSKTDKREHSSDSAQKMRKKRFDWTPELTARLIELLNDPQFHRQTKQGFYNVRLIADTLNIERKVVTSKIQTLAKNALGERDALKLKDHQVSNSAPLSTINNRKPDFRWNEEQIKKLKELLNTPEYRKGKSGRRDIKTIADILNIDTRVVHSKIQALEIQAQGKEAHVTQAVATQAVATQAVAQRALATQAVAQRARSGSESNLPPSDIFSLGDKVIPDGINTFFPLSIEEIEQEIERIESMHPHSEPTVYFSIGSGDIKSPIHTPHFPNGSPGVAIPYLLTDLEVANELEVIEKQRSQHSIKP